MSRRQGCQGASPPLPAHTGVQLGPAGLIPGPEHSCMRQVQGSALLVTRETRASQRGAHPNAGFLAMPWHTSLEHEMSAAGGQHAVHSGGPYGAPGDCLGADLLDLDPPPLHLAQRWCVPVRNKVQTSLPGIHHATVHFGPWHAFQSSCTRLHMLPVLGCLLQV